MRRMLKKRAKFMEESVVWGLFQQVAAAVARTHTHSMHTHTHTHTHTHSIHTHTHSIHTHTHLTHAGCCCRCAFARAEDHAQATTLNN